MSDTCPKCGSQGLHCDTVGRVYLCGSGQRGDQFFKSPGCEILELEARLAAAERERDAAVALLENGWAHIGDETVCRDEHKGCVAWLHSGAAYYRPLQAIRAALAAEGR